MEAAQRSLLIALEFRRDGLGYIAERSAPRSGTRPRRPTPRSRQIAGQMQAFLASDVLYNGRTVPLIKRALDDDEIGGQQIARSQFLPGIEWLEPADRRRRARPADHRRRRRPQPREPAPGLHGTGLESISVGDTRLQPDAPEPHPGRGRHRRSS